MVISVAGVALGLERMEVELEMPVGGGSVSFGNEKVLMVGEEGKGDKPELVLRGCEGFLYIRLLIMVYIEMEHTTDLIELTLSKRNSESTNCSPDNSYTIT